MATNEAAWIMAPKAKPLVVAEAPMPIANPDEVVIRNRAVAVNPIDWKVQEYGVIVKDYPNVLGCDTAGEVVEVGSNVTKFSKGDRVMAYVLLLS